MVVVIGEWRGRRRKHWRVHVLDQHSPLCVKNLRQVKSTSVRSVSLLPVYDFNKKKKTHDCNFPKLPKVLDSEEPEEAESRLNLDVPAKQVCIIFYQLSQGAISTIP